MKEILPQLDEWVARSEKIALATVVQTWGSSPRGVGAKMALTPDGKIAGSVSGGCVEGAVFEAGVETLLNGRSQLLHFGVADETAWQVGLACGGQVDVFVKPLDKEYFGLLRRRLQAGANFSTATIIRGPADLLGREMMIPNERHIPGSVPEALIDRIFEKAGQVIASGRSQIVDVQTEIGPIGIFVEVVAPQPVLIMVGGVHIAVALSAMAHTLGFRTVVIDPRRAFANPGRFPEVDQLIQEWPDEAFAGLDVNERTAVAVLTHDPKIDDPALQSVLPGPAFYVGALGSQTTQSRRRVRLLRAGLTESQLARLHGPIGLKLGAQTPEEIGLAILAEIIAVQHGMAGVTTVVYEEAVK